MVPLLWFQQTTQLVIVWEASKRVLQHIDIAGSVKQMTQMHKWRYIILTITSIVHVLCHC